MTDLELIAKRETPKGWNTDRILLTIEERDWLVAEVRRLRALLIAPPDDDEIQAAYRQFDLLGTTKQGVIAAFAVRARKIGDTDGNYQSRARTEGA